MVEKGRAEMAKPSCCSFCVWKEMRRKWRWVLGKDNRAAEERVELFCYGYDGGKRRENESCEEREIGWERRESLRPRGCCYLLLSNVLSCRFCREKDRREREGKEERERDRDRETERERERVFAIVSFRLLPFVIFLVCFSLGDKRLAVQMLERERNSERGRERERERSLLQLRYFG